MLMLIDSNVSHFMGNFKFDIMESNERCDRTLCYRRSARIYFGVNFRLIKLNLTRTILGQVFLRFVSAHIWKAHVLHIWPATIFTHLLVLVSVDAVTHSRTHIRKITNIVKCKLTKELTRKRTLQSIVLIQVFNGCNHFWNKIKIRNLWMLFYFVLE